MRQNIYFMDVYKITQSLLNCNQKEKDFFIVNTTVKNSILGHWILYYIKDCVLYFFDSFGQPLDIYGLDIESCFTTCTGDSVRLFNFRP